MDLDGTHVTLPSKNLPIFPARYEMSQTDENREMLEPQF
jgi:hypothetical protein